MGGSSSDVITQSFDLITQEVHKQQQVMECLEEENRELRRQLTNLRDGHGIFLEIEGRRFPLLMANNAPSHITRALPPVEVQPAYEPEEPTTTESDVKDVTEAPTIAMSEVDTNSIPEVPQMPRSVPTAQLPREEEYEEQKQEAPTSSFLEEMMLDEFAAAATSPMAVWTGPITSANKKQETLDAIDEEKKAALRKELMGSFLLE